VTNRQRVKPANQSLSFSTALASCPFHAELPSS